MFYWCVKRRDRQADSARECRVMKRTVFWMRTCARKLENKIEGGTTGKKRRDDSEFE